MCFKMILKATKNQGFTLSLEDAYFEKPMASTIMFSKPVVTPVTAAVLLL